METEPRPRRSGPRSDVDVPTVLLDTAERLFGQYGVDAVSLRQLARETDVAPTAVVYHFGDKDGLIAAVVSRRGRWVSPAVRQRLADLIADVAEPSPRQLVDAMLIPWVEVVAVDPRGAVSWLKVVHGLAVADHPIWGEVVTRDTEVIPLFLTAFRRVFPRLSDQDSQTLLSLALNSMMGALAGADQAGFGTPLGPDGLDPRYVDMLASFTAGGLVGFAADHPRAD